MPEHTLSSREAMPARIPEHSAFMRRCVEADTGEGFCSLHVRVRSGGTLIKGPCVVLVRHRLFDAGTVERMLKHRGVDHRWVLTRLACEKEMESVKSSRLIMSCYRDMDALAASQEEYPVPSGWLDEVRSLGSQLEAVLGGALVNARLRNMTDRKGQIRLF